MAATRTAHIVRTDRWIDPAFDAHIHQQAGLALDVFAAHGPEAEAWPRLQAADAYLVSAAKDELPRPWFVGADLLVRCPQLLCVSSSGAGYDTIDVEACTAAGVAVVNQAGGNAPSVAEHALGLMLTLQHRLMECDRQLRQHARGFSRESLMGRELMGKTLGLVGIGHIGRRVAALGQALGMSVLACDPLLTPADIEARGARPVSLPELLARSDVVSLHCPRDASTLRLMDAPAFAAMKPGALFISTARGGIHDEAALCAALQSGHLAGAGLDVWDQEPPPPEHPLLALDTVVATFHTAGVTHEGRRRVAQMAAEQVTTLLTGGRPPHLVNPDCWPAFEARRRSALGV